MPVRTERSDAVWTVIYSRPETRNAMDPDSAAALYEAFRGFDTDESAHVAVLWGEGGAFCSGWDLKHAAALSGADALDPFDFPDEGDPPMAVMGPSRLELSKPVIAAVAGPAVAGGMELALWADIRVMEETAYIGVYCRRWGIPLIDAGTVRLPRLVGEGRAMDLILTGPAGWTPTKPCASASASTSCPRAKHGRRPRRWPMTSAAIPKPACEPTAVRPVRSTV